MRSLLWTALWMLCCGLASAQGVLNTGNGDDPADPTVIEFEKTSLDLGTFKAGDMVNVTYKFKNAGDADLILDFVKPSCSCAKLTYPEKPIKPGGTGEISATIDTADKEGHQEKYFTVMYNGNPPVERLTLTFEVSPPDGAAPQGDTDGSDVK